MSKTAQDVMNEVHDEFQKEIKESDKEIVNKIEVLLKELKGQGYSKLEFKMFSEDELSRMGGSLAILKTSLGEMISKADLNYRLNEDLIKLKEANSRDGAKEEFASKGVKYNQADITAYIDKRLFGDRVKSSLKEEYAKRLQNLWWSLKSLLEATLKRIDVLQNQKKDSRIGKDSSVDFINS